MMVFRNILVVLDVNVGPDEALEDAVRLALQSQAKLTLLAAVPSVPVMGWLAPQLPWDPRYEAEQTSLAVLARARDRVPETLSVTTILSHESARSAVMTQARRGGHDLIIMGPGPQGRVSAWLHRRSGARLRREVSIPLLPVAELRQQLRRSAWAAP